MFFPADFDFVKGGKLPGMYGGHKGCSGGQDSEDCFSTRLMVSSPGPLARGRPRMRLLTDVVPLATVPIGRKGRTLPLRTEIRPQTI